MPRKSRIDAPGALHHIIGRGIERRAIFRDDRDRDDFWSRPVLHLLKFWPWGSIRSNGSPEHFMFLGRAGIGDQPDAIVAGVQDITTGGQHGCESR